MTLAARLCLFFSGLAAWLPEDWAKFLGLRRAESLDRLGSDIRGLACAWTGTWGQVEIQLKRNGRGGPNRWDPILGVFGAPPILEPILVGHWIFTGGVRDFDPWPNHEIQT